MNELRLIKSAQFGEVEADFYGRGNDVLMTCEQLASCLGYSSRKGIEKLMERNGYLKDREFSTTVNLSAVEGERDVVRERRVFTEDGIYEVTLLAKTERAKEFRAWVRKILKSLRTGKTKLVDMSEYQKLMTQTRAENARIRKAQILTRLADQYDGTFKQVLHAHATKELTGEYLLPLPKMEERTYSATEIGQRLGISANMVGLLANRNGLKTKEYGAWFNDKAKGHNKEVTTFRYYERVIPMLEQLIEHTA